MNFCVRCGAALEGARVCPKCGNQAAGDSANEFIPADRTTGFEAEDIAKNKVVAGLSYILFFLPLIATPESKFGKFHASQSLVLLIANIVWDILRRMIFRYIPIVGGLVATLGSLALVAAFIYYLVTALNGKAKTLPFFKNLKIF